MNLKVSSEKFAGSRLSRLVLLGLGLVALILVLNLNCEAHVIRVQKRGVQEIASEVEHLSGDVKKAKDDKRDDDDEDKDEDSSRSGQLPDQDEGGQEDGESRSGKVSEGEKSTEAKSEKGKTRIFDLGWLLNLFGRRPPRPAPRPPTTPIPGSGPGSSRTPTSAGPSIEPKLSPDDPAYVQYNQTLAAWITDIKNKRKMILSANKKLDSLGPEYVRRLDELIDEKTGEIRMPKLDTVKKLYAMMDFLTDARSKLAKLVPPGVEDHVKSEEIKKELGGILQELVKRNATLKRLRDKKELSDTETSSLDKLMDFNTLKLNSLDAIATNTLEELLGVVKGTKAKVLLSKDVETTPKPAGTSSTTPGPGGSTTTKTPETSTSTQTPNAASTTPSVSTTSGPSTTTTEKPTNGTSTTTTKPADGTSTTTSSKPTGKTTTTTNKPGDGTSTSAKPADGTSTTTTTKPADGTSTTTSSKATGETTTTTTNKPEGGNSTTTTMKPADGTSTTASPKQSGEISTSTMTDSDDGESSTKTTSPTDETTTATASVSEETPAEAGVTSTTREPISTPKESSDGKSTPRPGSDFNLIHLFQSIVREAVTFDESKFEFALGHGLKPIQVVIGSKKDSSPAGSARSALSAGSNEFRLNKTSYEKIGRILNSKIELNEDGTISNVDLTKAEKELFNKVIDLKKRKIRIPDFRSKKEMNKFIETFEQIGRKLELMEGKAGKEGKEPEDGKKSASSRSGIEDDDDEGDNDDKNDEEGEDEDED